MNQMWHLLMGSQVVHRLGWVLLHSMWLGAAVAALLAASDSVLRRRSAHARYLAGCAAMLAVVGLTAASWFLVPDGASMASKGTQDLVALIAAPASGDRSAATIIPLDTSKVVVSSKASNHPVNHSGALATFLQIPPAPCQQSR